MTTDEPTARRRISSGAVWEPIVGYSRAVRVGPWVAVSGTTTLLEGDEPVGGDDIAEQARTAIGVLTRALTEAGASLEDVIRTRMFVTDITRWEELAAVHGEVFGDIRPATSMVQVTALIHPRLLVEIEADAFITTPTSSASS